MRLLQIILSLCLLCMAIPSSGAPDLVDVDSEPRMWQHFQSAATNSERIQALLSLTRFYDKTGKEQRKYYVLSQAIGLARDNNDHEALNRVFAFYANLHNARGDVRYMDYADSMMQNAMMCREDACMAEAHMAKARGYVYSFQPQDALSESSLAVAAAERTSDPNLSIRSKLLMADAQALLTGTHSKVNAIGTYLHAQQEAANTDDLEALEDCHRHISWFYYTINGYDSALAYKVREITLAVVLRGARGDELQRLLMEVAAPMLRTGKATLGERIMLKVIRYASLHDNLVLLADALQYMRDYYINRDNLAAIVFIYAQYPKAWASAADNPPLATRLKAYIFEANKQADSASLYYQNALSLLQANNDRYQYAFLSVLYGKFLLRQQRVPEAIEQMKDGYRSVATSDAAEFMMRITGAIDKAYVQAGQYDSAYVYRDLYDAAASRWQSSVRSDEFLRQHLSAEHMAREQLAVREADDRNRRHITQYTFIGFGIAASFLILALLSSFPVPRWLIRATGLFAFIFLFEFIILWTEILSHHYTHGEPLMVMLFRITIIALLSPLHHWAEERTLHYFYEHKLLDPSKRTVYLNIKKLRGMAIKEKVVVKDGKKSQL
jgi:hypothetical protein